MLIAEFAPQAGVILTWPHAHSDWRGQLDAIEPVYVELARAIAPREALLLLCYDPDHRRHVHAQLAAAGIPLDTIRLVCVRTNDTWVRDYGPLVACADDQLHMLDFRFDGWGGKYAADLDDRVTQELLGANAIQAPFMQQFDRVLEGGSIDSDGQGTLLTTTACLHTARHPQLARDELERRLQTELGAARILWLDHGAIIGDDTDGHVDMLARFCTPGTIAHSSCDDERDPQFAGLQAMARQLEQFRTVDGTRYQRVELPLPAACHAADNRRLPASYANFLIINGAVLMPVYNDPADEIAHARLADCFPGRDVIDIDCTALIHQGGSLHCASMQLPAGSLAAS